MTAASLRALNCKILGQMAKKEGVVGWHSMRKEELVSSLVRVTRKNSRNKTKPRGAATRRQTSRAGSTLACGKAAAKAKAKSRRAASRVKRFQSAQRLLKLLGTDTDDGRQPTKDRLVVMVRGPYWLQVSWELRSRSVERASAALGQHWHTARPVLRLLEISRSGTTNSSAKVVREIAIHGGVNTWYVDIHDPPGTHQLDIGYLTGDGKFYSLARSNIVSTPAPGTSELDHNWDEVAQSCDKIYAMSGGDDPNGSAGDLRELFEERLRRPMGAPLVTRYGIGADRLGIGQSEFNFELDAEMIVFGSTSPNANVTFRGQPLELRADGSFTVRLAMPERRQVIPVVAVSADGVEQRTIALAVERNTKVMETQIREP